MTLSARSATRCIIWITLHWCTVGSKQLSELNSGYKTLWQGGRVLHMHTAIAVTSCVFPDTV